MVGSTTRIGPNGAAATRSDAFLTRNNPKVLSVLSSTPGLSLFLDRNTVSSGPRPGEVETKVDWPFWNHSAATGAKYGHSLTDDQIKSDVIVVFQPSTEPGAKVDFGSRSYPGHEIIGVFKVGDQITGVSDYDHGFIGEMSFTAHGKAGDKATLGWAVISVGPDGRVRSGGFPTSSGGKPVGYQVNKNGSEYHGRAAEIVQGQAAYVPVTDQ